MKRFPFMIQHDSMLCGVTCLQMVCKYFGRYFSQSRLSAYCSATREGVSLLSLSKAAEKVGLHITCVRISVRQLYDIPLPAILFWDQNHFVVLYKVRRSRWGNDSFYIADPARGKWVCQMEQMYGHWICGMKGEPDRGIVMCLQATPAFYKQKNDTLRKKRSFAFLFSYVKQYRRYFVHVLLGLLIGCLIQLTFPFLTQSIVDVGIAHRDIDFIYLVLAGQLMLVVSRTSLDFVRRWILLHISMRINIALVSDFFIKLLKLPMSFFDTKLLGDLMQRMNDHGRVENVLTTQTLSVMFSSLSFVVFSLILLNYNLLIFLVFMVGSLCYGGWIALFLKQRKRIDYLYFEKQAKNNNKTYQFITAMQEIKLQGCEQRRRWEWENVQADLFDVSMKNLRLQQVQEAGGLFINEIKNIVVTVLSATAVIDGDMTLGMMLAVQYIIGQLNMPVEQLCFIYSLQDVKISLERINEIHDVKNEDSEKGLLSSFKDKDNSLYVNQVGFKYDLYSPKKTLEGIRLVIPEGKVTAIVGASGSGKTTLVKLLLGYYQPMEGEIRIGQTSLSRYAMKWWRRQCGVVMQDGIIFSESIARNIAVGDGDIDWQRMVQAARIANIEGFVTHLPLKYDTVIGQDGVGLSQGQKQRVLIARAVYKNPKYIFLDEATNALDANNERAIVENLATFYASKTVVVVAHRLSTVKNADQIVVMDEGKVIETGTHASLIEAKGAYYNLIRNQLELGN